MSRIAVICARGGSKGVPGKNIRPLHGRPLIAWTIRHALDSGLFETVAVSSDADDILAAAGAAGATLLVKRPDELASDTISVLPAVAHCLAEAERRQATGFDHFALLQATSPTREPADLAGAVALFEAHRPGSVITGCLAKSSPYYTIVEEQAGGTVGLSKPVDPPFARRQDAPRCYDLNGSIYVIDRARFARDPRSLYPDSRLYEMSAENSVDIDSELDFLLAEAVLARRLAR
jgi:CMP-N,N'-diacetyllegionaminic acid synthase